MKPGYGQRKVRLYTGGYAMSDSEAYRADCEARHYLNVSKDGEALEKSMVEMAGSKTGRGREGTLALVLNMLEMVKLSGDKKNLRGALESLRRRFDGPAQEQESAAA